MNHRFEKNLLQILFLHAMLDFSTIPALSCLRLKSFRIFIPFIIRVPIANVMLSATSMIPSRSFAQFVSRYAQQTHTALTHDAIRTAKVAVETVATSCKEQVSKS